MGVSQQQKDEWRDCLLQEVVSFLGARKDDIHRNYLARSEGAGAPHRAGGGRPFGCGGGDHLSAGQTLRLRDGEGLSGDEPDPVIEVGLRIGGTTSAGRSIRSNCRSRGSPSPTLHLLHISRLLAVARTLSRLGLSATWSPDRRCIRVGATGRPDPRRYQSDSPAKKGRSYGVYDKVHVASASPTWRCQPRFKGSSAGGSCRTTGRHALQAVLFLGSVKRGQGRTVHSALPGMGGVRELGGAKPLASALPVDL